MRYIRTTCNVYTMHLLLSILKIFRLPKMFTKATSPFQPLAFPSHSHPHLPPPPLTPTSPFAPSSKPPPPASIPSYLANSHIITPHIHPRAPSQPRRQHYTASGLWLAKLESQSSAGPKSGRWWLLRDGMRRQGRRKRSM